MTSDPILMDLFGDLRAYCGRSLDAWGFEVDPSWDAWHTCYQWIKAQRQLIPQRPRTTEWSHELRERKAGLPADIVGGLTEIERRAAAGTSLNRYLSEGILNLRRSDHLLYEWNIHHFHVGGTRAPERAGFSPRGKWLLYATHSEERLYFIDVRDHSAFADRELFEIMKGNWPHLVEHRRLRDGMTIYPPMARRTNAEIHALRKAGIFTLTDAEDGSLFYPPGGGLTSAGGSVEVSLRANLINNTVALIDEYLRANASEIIKWFREVAYKDVDLVRLALTLEPPEVVVREVETALEIWRANPWTHEQTFLGTFSERS